MKTLYNIIFFILCLSQIVLCQSETITGIITDLQDTAIEGAVIIYYNTNADIISYSISDIDGQFSIDAKPEENYSLEVTHLAYKKKIYTIEKDSSSVINSVINMSLEVNANVLEEIVFTAKVKLKDTLNFDLDKMNLFAEDKLRDILNKIPNFKLGDDGSIQYKGKNIDKILVNEKPSFINQNSIALASIENKIIEGISLINNYSDDFMMDFNENKESVLNIDTKDKNKKILNGDAEIQYGYKNKFAFNSRAMMFSKNLNAFSTQNLNNIGNAITNATEINKLFSTGQPFSSFQSKSLASLFNTNENLSKDLFTSSNLTIRNQTERFKVSGLIYFIAPDRINSTIQHTSTYSEVPLYNSIDISQTKSQSLLGAFSIAYKAAPNTIISYNANGNYINSSNHGDSQFDLFENGIKNLNSSILTNNNNKIQLGFHQLMIQRKIDKNLILESKLAYFHEDTQFLAGYSSINNNSSLSHYQNNKYAKNETQGSVALKYHLSNSIIPLLTFKYISSQDNIHDLNSENGLIDRKIESYEANLKLSGYAINRYLEYSGAIGINPFSYSTREGFKKQGRFIPVKLSLDYEKQMHRYLFQYQMFQWFNDLDSGINTISDFGNILYGDRSHPQTYNKTNRMSASYVFNNLFDAKSYSVTASYSDQKNAIRRGFLQQNNGISEYKLFIADELQSFDINGFYSKMVLPLKFPTKLTFTFNYKLSKYPTEIINQTVDLINISYIPEINFETITNNFINFSLSSKLYFVSDKAPNNTFISRYSRSAFSILLKDQKWKGRVNIIFDSNLINSVNYTRTNVNFRLSRTVNKFTYSIESRHIGELLGIFKNTGYDTRFNTRDGISNTITNNQSLKYITLGINYNI